MSLIGRSILLLMLISPHIAWSQVGAREENLGDLAVLPVTAGGEAGITLRVRNTGNTSGPVTLVLANLRYGEVIGDNYRFQALSGGCTDATAYANGGDSGFRFPFGTLAGNEARTCEFRILRSAKSRDDLALTICETGLDQFTFCFGPRRLLLGRLPDLRLRLDQTTSDPASPGNFLVRLHVDNTSLISVNRRVVSTPCREFGGGIFDGTPYTIDTAFPGGCALTGGELCADFTGMSTSSFGFDVGPIPAESSRSCLVRLVIPTSVEPGRPRNGPFTMPLYFLDELMSASDGSVVVDGDPANDRAVLGPSQTRSIPAGSALTLFVLGFLVLWFGMRQKHSRRVTS